MYSSQGSLKQANRTTYCYGSTVEESRAGSGEYTSAERVACVQMLTQSSEEFLDHVPSRRSEIDKTNVLYMIPAA